jgi:hypothetical protein
LRLIKLGQLRFIIQKIPQRERLNTPVRWCGL